MGKARARAIAIATYTRCVDFMGFPLRGIVTLVQANYKRIELLLPEYSNELFRSSHIVETTNADTIERLRGRERLDGDVLMALLEIFLQGLGDLSGLKRTDLNRESRGG